MKTPIFGPFDVSRSTNAADNNLINLYPEIIDTKDGKAVGALYSTPGLVLQATVGAGPVRAMRPYGDILVVVSGPNLYSVSAAWAVTQLGGGIQEGVPVSIIANPTTIAVFAGNTAYTWVQGGGYGAINLPFVPNGNMSATYQDGFGLVNNPGTTQFYQSALAGFGSWNGLDVGDASGDPDPIVALAQIDREIWVIKQYETEIWYNAGTAGFAFGRLDGVYLESGCAAQASVSKNGESLIWLAKNTQGETVVVQTKGHNLRRLSTHALETRMQRFATVSDAVAYSYQQDGHKFYVLTFPTANETWVCDITDTEMAGVGMWHQRGAFNAVTGDFDRHWGISQALFGGYNLVGDYRNGSIYRFSLDALTDAGAQRKWLRSWRALKDPVNYPVRFAELRIDMQTGITIPDGTSPRVVLRWSDDGGHTWSPEHYTAAGAPGETARRVMYRRMGSTRRNHGLDRIFELSSSDQFPVAIIGAELEAG